MAGTETSPVSFLLWTAILIYFVQSSTSSYPFLVEDLPVLMPNARPSNPETYLCSAVRVDPRITYNIVGYSPNASMGLVHHMFLMACEEPGSHSKIWGCGHMGGDGNDGLEQGPPCAQGEEKIYAWGRNAPKLNLPDGVSFKIGKNTKLKYIILQIHYADISSLAPGESDNSGVVVHYTETEQPKSAGVYLLGTGGEIPPMKTTLMESACGFDEPKVIHPFAFRTHTHSLGQVVSGYRVREGEWTLIGKKDPMLPQMFYPVDRENEAMTIEDGDILAARCTMVSNRTRVTYIGSTNQDEMCNFYIMYWMEGPESLKKKSCWSSGAPYYYWNDPGTLLLPNIPDDASIL